MRSIINFIFLIAAGVIFFAACDKKDRLPTYQEGVASVLSSSTNIVLSPAADSNNIVLTLNWTNPQYATDKASYKYVMEMDSTGKNFAKADTRTVTGQLNTSFTAKELTNLLLARGYAYN